MSIKVRIYGGFLVVLLLTLGVGAVGWLSLTRFAQRVEMADAAQNLLSKTGDLALAANRALLTGKEAPARETLAERDGLREAIKSLGSLGAGHAETEAAIKSMTLSVDAFEKLLAQYGAEQSMKTRLQSSHHDLVDHLQTTVASIADAQRDLLKRTNEALGTATKDQIKSNTQLTIANHLMRVGYELRALEAKAEAKGAEAEVAPIERSLGMLDLLIKKEASNPDLQDRVAAIKQSLANYRTALAAVGQKQAEASSLPPLSEKLLSDLGGIGNVLLKTQSDIEMRLGEARDHVESAPSFST